MDLKDDITDEQREMIRLVQENPAEFVSGYCYLCNRVPKRWAGVGFYVPSEKIRRTLNLPRQALFPYLLCDKCADKGPSADTMARIETLAFASLQKDRAREEPLQ